jgi:hypothetical protein
MVSEPKILNGTVYVDPHTCKKLVLMHIDKGKYAMLYVHQGAVITFVPSFQFDVNGEFMFTMDELKAFYHFDDWVKLDQCINIVNIEQVWNTRAL